jgi:hypothetical protein
MHGTSSKYGIPSNHILRYLEMASCWTLSKHPLCFHTLHSCQPSYTPQRH